MLTKESVWRKWRAIFGVVILLVCLTTMPAQAQEAGLEQSRLREVLELAQQGEVLEAAAEQRQPGEALEMAAEQTQQGEVLESTEEQGADSADITEVSRFMTAEGEIEAKASPREDAETVIRYQSGDKIYVTGELADGWCRVRYQDLTGYIRPAQAAEIERDVEALDDEFAAAESEGKLVVEEVERQRTETKRSRIWGAVILLLVAGIFVTGIFSVVRSRRTEDTEQ